ncbi:MAG: hypothetical protein HQL67_06500 [Magnetococcales bacterium]|nr:hypothetical protein [Magnetococcales bacterium]
MVKNCLQALSSIRLPLILLSILFLSGGCSTQYNTTNYPKTGGKAAGGHVPAYPSQVQNCCRKDWGCENNGINNIEGRGGKDDYSGTHYRDLINACLKVNNREFEIKIDNKDNVDDKYFLHRYILCPKSCEDSSGFFGWLY